MDNGLFSLPRLKYEKNRIAHLQRETEPQESRLNSISIRIHLFLMTQPHSV